MTGTLNTMVKVFRMRTNTRRRKSISPTSSSTSSPDLSRTFSELDDSSSCCAGGEEGDASTTSQWSSLSIRTEPCVIREEEEEYSNRGTRHKTITTGTGKTKEDPVLSMVVYDSSSSSSGPQRSLPDAYDLWLRSAHTLLQSKEMVDFAVLSRDVVFSAGSTVLHKSGMVIQIACLPITIPCKVVASTTDVIRGTTGMVLGMAVEVLRRTPPSIEQQPQMGENASSSPTSSKSPVDELIGTVTNVIPYILQTVGRVTNVARSTALQLVSAPAAPFSAEKSVEQDNTYLDRLRLDYGLPKQRTIELNPAEDECARGLVGGNSLTPVSSSDVSKYLLRVNDVNMESSSSDDEESHHYHPSRILYIDLSKDFSDDTLRNQAMDRLVARGLALVSTNAYARSKLPAGRKSASFEVEWKPEGSTARTIRKLAKMTELDQEKRLAKEMLVWSGKYQGPNYYGSDNPLFLAQGIIDNLSPREFLDLMWNSSRTGEYNKYSLGRSDMVTHEDNVLSGGAYGTKVIKSETKVPFTGISLVLSALMHARPLEGGSDTPDKKGFVIVSRSLDSGVAGSHVGHCNGVEKGSKNEILWGINVLLPVPGSPNCTHLISLSQVNATLVPPFLAKRIGLMGVEDFFKNVRAV